MPDPPFPRAREGPDGFEPLAIVYSLPEASVLVTTLAAYGIAAVALNQGALSAMPSLMVALGGIWIMVPPEQRNEAKALMAEIDRGWTCPPLAVSGDGLAGAALWVAILLFCVVPPPPRTEGRYAWRRALQAGSGSSAR